ncbi:hypothetical protein [Litoreibacter arenae]|uniref:Uncharacterized protein n=1 Tax=Litoreibacter arenae DSM 19593 TaxID=1123360 RepID=S9RHX4_9RHOB|nr:hypothetical protein [Litoreibacter arenae]EPX77690.1 hypothetical protein thalar_03415 [Litoreibacter arenae DSM 19593]
MNIVRPVVFAASLALAGPALAFGGASFTYMPSLTYPTQEGVVSKDATSQVSPSSTTCNALERDADVQPDACGTLTNAELVKRKLARDE